MKKNNTTQLTLKYYWDYARPHKGFLFLLFTMLPIGVICGDIIIPLYIKELLDLISEFPSDENRIELWPELLPYILNIAGIWSIVFVAWRIFEFSVTNFESKVMRNLERSVYKKLQEHSYNFFANNFVGALVNRTNRFVRSFEVVADKFLFDLYSNTIRIVAAIGVLFIFVPLIAWILLGWTLFFLVAVYWFATWKLKYDIRSATADSAVTAELADGVTNITTTKTFAQKPYEIKRFWDITQYRYLARKLSWTLDNANRAMQSALMLMLEVGFIFVSVKLWVAGNISIGTIILIQMYLGAIMKNLWNIGRVIRELYQAFADAEEMTQILNTPAEIKDLVRPQKCKIARGKVEFQKVVFNYETGKDIFQNFDLKIKAGEKVGLVGESGAGKTTITKLLLRFVDINSGKILIDDQDISKIKQEDLRSSVAFVPQDPILFHRTLLENIQYGNLEANEKAVIEAAKQANAHEFIQRCPLQYETLVGERGIKLSGGEKQRVAIARAMLKNAPILILDEATSSLDSNSEQLIQEALKKLMKNRTTIVIAHRLSTIQKMDRIIVLDRGVVVEEGSHNELLKKKEKYAELWNHQVGGFIQ